MAMANSVSGKTFLSMPSIISLAFTAMLATTGKADLVPPLLPFPLPLPIPGGPGGLLPWKPEDIQKCWSTLTSIPGCLMEVSTSLSRGQIGFIGPACCGAITQISDSCWPKMFPTSPITAPFLTNLCSATPPSASGTIMNAVNKKLSAPAGLLPSLPGAGAQVKECWSSLANINGCLSEIYRSVGVVQVGAIGPACCEAITKIKDNCWPNMFPLQPSLPPLLKKSCLIQTNVSSAAAAPPAK